MPRVFYCINHTTLLKNDVLILRKLGFEVYVPKSLPSDEGAKISASVDLSYDSATTLKRNILDQLNSVNFYDSTANARILNLIEGNFSFVITAAYHVPVLSFLRAKIPVYIRVFGREMNLTYGEYLPKNVISRKDCKILSAYEHLYEVEKMDLARRFIFAPITCEPQPPYRIRSVTEKAVLYQRSRLHIHKEFITSANSVAETFAASAVPVHFYGTETHLIPEFRGKNLGRLTDEEVKLVFSSYVAMYYDSVDERHLHYHPLEAMHAGMPVVFLQKGMLGRIFKDSYGMANDVPHAIEIIRRLVNGDEDLSERIVAQQSLFVTQYFGIDSRIHTWKKIFARFLLN